MKKSAFVLAVFVLTLGSLAAQTVPPFLNYQGTLRDGEGKPLGATGDPPNFQPAPTNRKVIFRLWGAQNAGTLLWSETQTVTVSLGEFSVLLGQGAETVLANNPVPEPRPALDTIFTSGGVTRFLEIVVDDGDGSFTATDLPIAPRQRLTTTAYSFRAARADSVAANAINGPAIANGSITNVKIDNGAISSEKIADGTIVNADLSLNSVSSTNIVDGAVQNVDLADSSVDSRVIANQTIVSQDLANEAVTQTKIAPNAVVGSKILDGTVGTAKLADGAVTAAKLNATSVGFWTVAGGGANVTRPTGNVGIGFNNPTAKLQVDGDVVANTVRARAGEPGSGGSSFNGFAFNGNANTGLFSVVPNELSLYTQNGERMRILPNGNIGIGTNSPEVRLDVAGASEVVMTEKGYNGFGFVQDADGTFVPQGIDNVLEDYISTYTTRQHRVLDYDGPNNDGKTRWRGPVGIRTDSWMATRMGLLVYSDRRIKKDLQASSPSQDLAAIRRLKVTDYRMVDRTDGGTAWRRGFIAQEIEQVLPGAVTRSTEFIPDIFSRALELDHRPIAKTLLLTLKKDHNLKVGERVRLHMDGKRHDLEVAAVPSPRTFEVAECETAPEAVFVYGRQVKDFRTVDYDHIFTTSVGALQELKREKDAEVLALQEENARLRVQLAAHEALGKAHDARLAALERRLAERDSDVRAVSLPAGE